MSLRVLLCIHHRLDRNTGAPGVTLRLRDEYLALGHEVRLLSQDDLPARMPKLAEELLFPEFAAGALERRRRHWAPDVIDASTGDAWLWARLRGARWPRPALVTRSHGLEHTYWDAAEAEARAAGERLPARTRLYHGRFRLFEVAESLRRADVSIFLNHKDAEYAMERLSVDEGRTAVVPNGLPDYLLGVAPETGAAPAVAVIGSWEPRKGARHAAAALDRLLDRHPEARVSAIGTRLDAAEVRAGFSAPNRERVSVVPSFEHRQLPRLLRGHGVVLSASLADGFGLSVLEGMACGLAPVATAVAGTLEFVEHERNGLLVPPGHPDELAAAVERLFADPSLQERLRAQAHADAQSYGWRRIAQRNVDAYERALDARAVG